MFRQRAPSHDCHVQVVAPGVWPGVWWAVMVVPPSVTVSPSVIDRMPLVMAGNASVGPEPNCGSSGTGWPRASACAVDGLASTVARVYRCIERTPPRWS